MRAIPEVNFGRGDEAEVLPGSADRCVSERRLMLCVMMGKRCLALFNGGTTRGVAEGR